MAADDRAFRSTLQIIRPANTTAYTAGDVIGNSTTAVHQLTNVGNSGGFIQIQSVRLLVHVAAVPSGMAGFRLHLYSGAPVEITDNAAHDLVASERSTYMAYIDLPTPVDFGSTLFSQVDFAGPMLRLGSGQSAMWCELQTLGGFTPAANSEVYDLRVNAYDIGY